MFKSDTPHGCEQAPTPGQNGYGHTSQPNGFNEKDAVQDEILGQGTPAESDSAREETALIGLLLTVPKACRIVCRQVNPLASYKFGYDVAGTIYGAISTCVDRAESREPTHQQIYEELGSRRDDPLVKNPALIQKSLDRVSSFVSACPPFRTQDEAIQRAINLAEFVQTRYAERLRLSQQTTKSATVDSPKTDNSIFSEKESLLYESSIKPWPEPASASAYHGLAGDIVRCMEPHTEADPMALLFQFLVAFGNVIGRNAYLVAGGSRHYLNLFLILAGVTSKGRKGTSWSHVHGLFEMADPDWAGARMQSGLSSGEGLIWAVRDPIVKTEPIKEKGRHTGEYDEVTLDQGISDKRLLAQESEFSSQLRVMAREGNTLSSVLRLCWDSGNLNSLTKNSPAKATGAHISIIGHITQYELRQCMTATESVNGFGNRFLWICVRRSKLLPEGGGEVSFGGLVQHLHEAIEFARDVGEIKRDEEARVLWAKVYPELSEGKLGLFGALTGRAEAQVMRMSALYALLDQSPLVRRVHLEAALALWTFCEDSVRCIFGDAPADPVAAKILDALQSAYPEGVALSTISRELFQRNYKAEQLKGALSELLHTGQARRAIHTGAGRPSEIWYALKSTASPSTTT